MFPELSLKLIRFLAYFTVLIVPSNSVSMEFRTAANGGNCIGCSWIVAEGAITKETPAKFKEFLKTREAFGFEVVLDSPGGHLFGGIELGRKIRELGLHTTIAKSQRPNSCVRDEDCSIYYEEFYAGSCLSACAYAFLGGVQRQVSKQNSFTGHPKSMIGFHQFYGHLDKESRIAEIVKEETYFSSDQFVSALLAQYLTDMGVDPNVLSVAAFAGPDEMEFPKLALRRKLKIDYNPDFSFGELDLEVYKGGLLGFSKPNYDNSFNKLKQLTFYCRDESTLNILLTVPRLKSTDYDLITEKYGVVRLNLDKGVDWHDHQNDNFIMNINRIRQWSDDVNSYVNIVLNNYEKRELLNARQLAINLDVARVRGNFKAYLELDDQSYQSLQLISKTCF